MKTQKIVKDLIKNRETFTSYDVLCILRKAGAKYVALKTLKTEIREITRQITGQGTYIQSMIQTPQGKRLVNHPKGKNPAIQGYDPNKFTCWEKKVKGDHDLRINIPKNMLIGVPKGIELSVTSQPGELTICKHGKPNRGVQIQPIRGDLRINPTTLKSVGIAIKANQQITIKKSPEGIKITV